MTADWGLSRRTQAVLTWKLRNDRELDWGVPGELASDLEAALAHLRKVAKDPPDTAVSGEIKTRDHWSGPWVVVEPVTVEGRSE